MSRTGLFFGCGAMAALIAGWLGFPRLMYTRQAQPVEFRHKTHAAKSGNADCSSCHTVREDGAFTGIPRTQDCAACHAEPMGTTAAEAVLVNNFVKARHETPWLANSRQPANVRFSHAIHTSRGGLTCQTCHGSDGGTDVVPVYGRNRISGYAQGVMSMDDCEACHRAKGFEVGCLGCHE